MERVMLMMATGQQCSLITENPFAGLVRVPFWKPLNEERHETCL